MKKKNHFNPVGFSYFFIVCFLSLGGIFLTNISFLFNNSILLKFPQQYLVEPDFSKNFKSEFDNSQTFNFSPNFFQPLILGETKTGFISAADFDDPFEEKNKADGYCVNFLFHPDYSRLRVVLKTSFQDKKIYVLNSDLEKIATAEDKFEFKNFFPPLDKTYCFLISASFKKEEKERRYRFSFEEI